jgi:hypothetical protein
MAKIVESGKTRKNAGQINDGNEEVTETDEVVKEFEAKRRA